MAEKKKKKNDDIKLSGFPRILHKVVMFFTYPFRKPIRFVIFLLILLGIVFIIPLFHGSKPTEVHTWYMQKAKNIDVSSISKNITDMVTTKIEPKGVDKLVDVPQEVKTVRRQMFERASMAAPQPVDFLAESADDIVRVEEIVRDEVVIEQSPSGSFKVSETVTEVMNVVEQKPLRADGVVQYLDNPEEIIGSARVYNANELEVNGTYIFLYGIYSNPRSARGVKAGVFLKGIVKGEKVRCAVLAYTEDEVATAECFVGNVSINRLLVEKGYSDKVSLQ